MIAHGLGEEMRGRGIASNALWPATIVESQASINFELGDRQNWRKATVLADATLEICMSDPNQLTGAVAHFRMPLRCTLTLVAQNTGNALIDEEFLRSVGYTDSDFVNYRYDPNVEPPKLGMFGTIRRGDVREQRRARL